MQRRFEQCAERSKLVQTTAWLRAKCRKQLLGFVIGNFGRPGLPLVLSGFFELHQPHIGFIVRRPISFVEQLVNMCCLDVIEHLITAKVRDSLGKSLSLFLLALLAAQWVIEFSYPDRPSIFDELFERPLGISSVHMPDANLPWYSVLLHALEGTHMSPSLVVPTARCTVGSAAWAPDVSPLRTAVTFAHRGPK